MIAGEDFKQLNRAIKEVSIKSGVLLATIIRNSQVIIPRGNDVIKNGDRVILITMKEQAVTNLNQLIK